MLDPSRIDPSLARVVQGFPLSRGRRNARAEAPVTRAFLYATLIDSPLLIFVFAFYFFFSNTRKILSIRYWGKRQCWLQIANDLLLRAAKR